MKTLASWLVGRILTPHRLSRFLASMLASILRKASKSENWDTYKAVIDRVGQACKLFSDVYEDDAMSKEEEERVAQAIEDLGSATLHVVAEKAPHVVKML